MRKSGEIIGGNPAETTHSSRVRRLINLLFTGTLLLALSSTFDERSVSDNVIKNKTCEESRRDMFKGIKIVPDSESKKNESKKKPKKEDNTNNPEKPCNDCKLA
jgi:hypothetical protein